jgi:DMSO/TMAO reductase YedYZ heme-binding membrane subunit
MSIIERIQSAGNVVKAVIGLMALFPGIAVLIALVDIPPSLGQTIKVIAFSVCVVVVLSVFLLDDWLARLRRKLAIVGALLGVIAGAACLQAYRGFAQAHVVEINAPPPHNLYIAPRTPSQDILNIVDPVSPGRPTVIEYRQALGGSNNSDQLKQLMDQESGWTTVIMIALLILSEVLLIAPVVALVWKLASSDSTDGAGPPARPRRRKAGVSRPRP